MRCIQKCTAFYSSFGIQYGDEVQGLVGELCQLDSPNALLEYLIYPANLFSRSNGVVENNAKTIRNQTKDSSSR